MSNIDPTKYQGWTQVLRKGKQFLMVPTQFVPITTLTCEIDWHLWWGILLYKLLLVVMFSSYYGFLYKINGYCQDITEIQSDLYSMVICVTKEKWPYKTIDCLYIIRSIEQDCQLKTVCNDSHITVYFFLNIANLVICCKIHSLNTQHLTDWVCWSDLSVVYCFCEVTP